MRKLLTDLVAWARQEKNERMLVIVLPVIALIACALILAPQISVYKANRAAAMDALRAQSERKSEQTAYTGEVSLRAVSNGEDMYITVCDSFGNAVTGVRFLLSLTTPDGDEILCSTYDDGSCYLVELAPGNYVISLISEDNLVICEDIICSVPSVTHEGTSLSALAPGLNRVDGKLYYKTSDGRTAKEIGIDISCFSTSINWEALREEGVDFVILRIGGRGWGSGRIYIDKLFREYYEEAYYADFKLGVYFYSTAVNTREAVEEAEFVVSTLAGAPLDLPVYFDTEYSGDYPNGRADKLTPAERESIINAFCSVIRQHGYEAGLYSGVYFVEHELSKASTAHSSLWIANYTRNSVSPNVPYRYDLWQYTESGKINSVRGSVDINVRF